MKIPKSNTKHLLTVTDFNKKEIIDLFKFTEKLKKLNRLKKKHHLLKNKTLGMIFEKNSTRTRVSFETGIFQLGGNGIFLNSNDIQLGRGEAISDTARVLSRYVDLIMIRTFGHEKVEELAKFSDIPVINGLTDSFHPCQALTDFFTIYEYVKTDLDKIKITYIGDGNNMVNSLILCAAILGSNISVATPKQYAPDNRIIEQAKKIAVSTGSEILLTDDINEAAYNADYLYTDVWASMGQEDEIEIRKRIFSEYKITLDLIENFAPNCKVMHCLPAHRGEEIDSTVIDSKNSIIFDQAENRLHVQKAIMGILMNNKK